MSCYQPVEVSYQREGGDRQNNTVGCGQCLGCRQEQARQWAIRLVHESTQHARSWFITLTYEDDELPEHGSLNPEDTRAFIRRLRRYYYHQQRRTYYTSGSWLPGFPRTLSYYLCAEYGPQTLRPHYHAVCFGPDLPDRSHKRGDGRSMVWESSILNELWRHGIAEFSSVNMGSASYVAQYVRKKVAERDGGLVRLYDENAKRYYHPRIYTRVDGRTGELVPVTPEFSRMSRRPAIGRRWIEKYWSDVYPRDYVVIDGKEVRPPRYYDKWLEERHPEVWSEVRISRSKKHLEELVDDACEYPVVEDREERRLYRERGIGTKIERRQTLFARSKL